MPPALKLLQNAALALALLAAPLPLQAQTRIDIPAARTLVFQMVANGDYPGASALARTLIEADPNDQAAWLGLAQAQRAMGQTREAVQSARRAWDLSQTPENRYAAATVAAQTLASDGARLRAQFWLRRAAQIAPNDQLRDRAIQDFRFLRRTTPLSARLSFSVTPTSNINNGAKSDRVAGGQISGAALALSGLEYSLGVALAYRLPAAASASAPRQSHLGLSLQSRSYTLSSAARAISPASRNGDFAFQELELSHDTSFASGKDGSARVDLGFRAGANWYAGAALSSFVGATLQRQMRAGAKTTLTFGGGIERISRIDAADRSSTVTRLFGRWDRAIGDDRRLSLSVSASDAASTSALIDNRVYSLSGQYRLFDAPLGTEIGLSLSYADRDYRQPLPFFGMRRDRTTSLGIDVTLKERNYYGFAPTLGLTASRTNSTIGLYDTETLGIRIGLRSVF